MSADEPQPETEVQWRVRDGHSDDADFLALLRALFGPEPEGEQLQADPAGGR